MLKGLGGRVGLGVTWRFRVSITQLEGSYRGFKTCSMCIGGSGGLGLGNPMETEVL